MYCEVVDLSFLPGATPIPAMPAGSNATSACPRGCSGVLASSTASRLDPCPCFSLISTTVGTKTDHFMPSLSTGHGACVSHSIPGHETHSLCMCDPAFAGEACQLPLLMPIFPGYVNLCWTGCAVCLVSVSICEEKIVGTRLRCGANLSRMVCQCPAYGGMPQQLHRAGRLCQWHMRMRCSKSRTRLQ